MKNVKSTDAFHISGGSEFAPMSSTSDLAVAIAYGQSECSLLFKIMTKSFMNRGADITFLSCFPSEREFLFPPLTFLRPTGRPPEVIKVDVNKVCRDVQPSEKMRPPPSLDGSRPRFLEFRVVEVEPIM
mmetsp:Transcript_81613/g.162394  ORF Transcript_81613/g.162394 Transcript_81613/m.162394 type:complete len:129 (-) Transcript_81613:233-619(-)